MNSTSLKNQDKPLFYFSHNDKAFVGLAAHIRRNLTERQQGALAKFTKAMGGLCWWRMGTGKTRISLFWFATLQNLFKWSLPSVCVVICRRRAFYDWKKEINKLFPMCDVWQDEIPTHPPGDSPCFLLLSEGMISKMVPIYARMRTIRVVIEDEGWLYSNPKSSKHEAAYRFGMGRKSLLLSGTVMKARDTAEVWAQAKVASKHMRLASSLTKFRSEFQVTDATRGFPSFSPKKGSYARIMQKLEDCSDVYFPKSERTITEQYHDVPATPLQSRYFQELRDYFSLEDHKLEFNSALTTALKAQQISDGFVKLASGEYVNLPTFKFEKLKDELESILTEGATAVVWCAFRHTVEILRATLPFATLQMVGGVDFDIAAWERGDAKICIATEASGSSINYFKDTAYALYYSANYKWKDMEQSRWRHNRHDSSHDECFYKYFCVEGSLDRHVLDVAMGSGDRELSLIKQGEVSRWVSGGK